MNKTTYCNQTIKDNTLKCNACGASEPLINFPCSVEFFLVCLNGFIKLHADKGCNKSPKLPTFKINIQRDRNNTSVQKKTTRKSSRKAKQNDGSIDHNPSGGKD